MGRQGWRPQPVSLRDHLEMRLHYVEEIARYRAETAAETVTLERHVLENLQTRMLAAETFRANIEGRILATVASATLVNLVIAIAGILLARGG